MRTPKIVIVGAGPAGGSCAVALGKRRFGEVVLLDKSKYPRRKVCGSGLSPLALQQLQELDMLDHFPNHASIRGLHAIAPGGGDMVVEAGEGAWVVPRTEFDHALAVEASRLGADFRPETKAIEFLEHRGRICGVRTKDEEIEADLVVCADGAASRFVVDDSPREVIQTLMGWWKGTKLPRDKAVMVWDRRLDGYYAWSFPEPDDTVNIGITIPSDAPWASRLKQLFQDILDEYFMKDMQDAEQLGKWMGHPAVVSKKVGPMAKSHAIWVGEAARLVMPATVEGIGFAMESGIYAAQHLEKHFTPQTGLSRFQQEAYRVGSGRKVLPKFWAGEAFRQIMKSQRARWAMSKVMNDKVRTIIEKGAARLAGDDLRTNHEDAIRQHPSPTERAA